MGRTSTRPSRAGGIFAATRTASSRSRQRYFMVALVVVAVPTASPTYFGGAFPGGARPARPAAFRRSRPPPEREVFLPQPTTVLCLASYEKGEEFLREAAERGARVVLLTVDALLAGGPAAW